MQLDSYYLEQKMQLSLSLTPAKDHPHCLKV